MKRFFAAPLFALTLALVGCGNDSPMPPPTDPPTTPPTTPPVTPPVTPPTMPPTDPPTTGSALAGTVTAPAGGDVSGTVVFACYNNDTENCFLVSQDGVFSDGYSGAALVGETGATGTYAINNLQAVQFSLIAAKDSNGDGQPNAGDYIGVYTADGQNVTLITPPQAGLAIALIDIADLETATDADSLAGALHAAETFLTR